MRANHTAFGQTKENTATLDQPLRWKARWHYTLNGAELYDMRARQWAPEIGAFISVDEYGFFSSRSTLWGWPGQNPVRYRDPTGHYAGPAMEVALILLANPELVPLAIVVGALTVIAIDVWEYEHPTIVHGSSKPNGDGGGASCPSGAPAGSGASPEAAPQPAPGSPRDAGADAEAGRQRGVIYLRRDRLGGMKDYVGQAESEAHFELRQQRHAGDYPNADFEFFVLERPDVSDLDVAEESWIRAGGGPTRRGMDGGLSNHRFQMSGPAYIDAGGGVPWP